MINEEFDLTARYEAFENTLIHAENCCRAAALQCQRARQAFREIGVNPFASAEKIAEQIKRPIVRVHAKHRSDEQWDADQARQERDWFTPQTGPGGL